jgi:hypothetical protein
MFAELLLQESDLSILEVARSQVRWFAGTEPTALASLQPMISRHLCIIFGRR